MPAFMHDQEFWFAVAFVILLGFGLRPGLRMGRGALDGRAKKVQDELDEARRLRDEAQRLVDEYKSKQQQALKDAAAILEAAKDEAELMRREGEAALKRSLAAREAQAKDRIAQAEQAAVQAVKDRAVEIAIRAATGLMSEAIDGNRAAQLVDQAIDELPQRARA